MFDISFTELSLIALVALVVLGPEKLLRLSRQAGQWLGRLRRYVDDVKSDISKQAELAELRKLQTEVQQAAESFKGTVESAMGDARESFDEIEQSVGSVNAGQNDRIESASTPRAGRTDWEVIYETRRTRERLKERRLETERDRGRTRPKRNLYR